MNERDLSNTSSPNTFGPFKVLKGNLSAACEYQLLKLNLYWFEIHLKDYLHTNHCLIKQSISIPHPPGNSCVVTEISFCVIVWKNYSTWTININNLSFTIKQFHKALRYISNSWFYLFIIIFIIIRSSCIVWNVQ